MDYSVGVRTSLGLHRGLLNSANLMVKQAKLFSPGETPSLNDSQQV